MKSICNIAVWYGLVRKWEFCDLEKCKRSLETLKSPWHLSIFALVQMLNSTAWQRIALMYGNPSVEWNSLILKFVAQILMDDVWKDSFELSSFMYGYVFEAKK